MNKPKSIYGLLNEYAGVDWFIVDDNINSNHQISIRTNRELTDKEKLEIERSIAYYSGPTKVNFKVIGIKEWNKHGKM